MNKIIRIKKNKKNKKSQAKQGMPWYEKIPRTLLEDALNVLADEPKTHTDIFHFLCAATLRGITSSPSPPPSTNIPTS